MDNRLPWENGRHDATIAQYQEQLYWADSFMLEAYDALNHCGLIQPEKDSLELQARDLEKRGQGWNARFIRSLQSNVGFLVASACDTMAEHHELSAACSQAGEDGENGQR